MPCRPDCFAAMGGGYDAAAARVGMLDLGGGDDSSFPPSY